MKIKGSNYSVSLSDFKGKPYVQAVINSETGVYAKVLLAQKANICLTDANSVIQLLNTTFTMENEKLLPLLKDQNSLVNILNNLKGITTLSSDYYNAVFNAIDPNDLVNPSQRSYVADLLLQVIFLSLNIFVTVTLDDQDAVYNVSYQPPQQKSGRSFAVHANEIMDLSDDALWKMISGVTSEQALTELYSAILDILLFCNNSTLSSASWPEIIVGFLSVYIAEQIRSAMYNFQEYSWEVDLLQVLILASYVNLSNMIFKDGQFVPGAVTNFSDDRGLGHARKDFTKLSVSIVTYLSQAKPDLYNSIKSALPPNFPLYKNGDLIRDLVAFISSGSYVDSLTTNAQQVKNIVLQLKQVLSTNYEDITTFIKNNS